MWSTLVVIDHPQIVLFIIPPQGWKADVFPPTVSIPRSWSNRTPSIPAVMRTLVETNYGSDKTESVAVYAHWPAHAPPHAAESI